jgi:GT2 family glycosyltransferase
MGNDIGTVVIGRNEGERLRHCLQSLLPECPWVVYVDSASTDHSVTLARELGVDVVELDGSRPLNASRARQEGFARLLSHYPKLEYVFFLDGDCEVVAGWLALAVATLAARHDAGVVCGRRRERRPERSIFNRLCDIEWDTPIGEALACGGDAVMRVSAYREAGGFDPTVPAGEEPELCHRMRRAGWKILRIEGDMTWHDANITRFTQWWRRYLRSGHGALHLQERFGLAYFARINRSIRIWILGWPALVAVAGLIGAKLGGNEVAIVLATAMLAVLPAQMIRVAMRARRRGLSPRDALGYGALIMLAKIPEAVGQLRYLLEKRRGLVPSLIEYK